MIRPAQVLSLIIAGVVLAGAGVWLVSRHAGNSADATESPVLPLKPADLNAVTRIEVFKGDGSRTTLTRDATHWIVTQRGYPADTGEVRKLLLDVSNLKVEELKTADPTLYTKLGVEEPRGAQAASTGLQLDVNGKTLGLIIGKTADTSSVYVRVMGQAQSLLATPPLAPDADPRHWLDRSILDIPPEQVTQMDLQPKDGPAYSIKRPAGAASSDFVVSPIPKGRELADASAATTQAGALAGLQLDDVRKAATHTGLSHLQVHTRDGLTLAISGISEGEMRYISVAAAAETPAAQQKARDLNARLAGWEFELPGYRYDTLFRPLEQLLKPKSSAPTSASPRASRGPIAPSNSLPFSPRGQDQGGPGKVAPQQSH